jgi:hypothetical protein
VYLNSLAHNPKLRAAIDDISNGRVASGFDQLDGLGVIKEFKDPAERHRSLVQTHLAAIKEGKGSLIVAPTHVECREVAKEVRDALRVEGMISGPDHSITRLQSLGLTDAQRSDAASYELGGVVQFHKRVSGGFKVGEQWQIAGHMDDSITVERNGIQKRLPIERVSAFEVYRQESLAVAIGDTIRVTKNFKEFKNNSLYKVTGISADSIELDGRSVPKGMVHIDQGVAVTSHAAQGKTVDQVLVSASIESFSQVNAKQFYVSMSRARESMQLFTDSTHALREAVLRDGSRKSVFDYEQAAENSIEFARKIVDLQQSKRMAHQVPQMQHPWTHTIERNGPEMER